MVYLGGHAEADDSPDDAHDFWRRWIAGYSLSRLLLSSTRREEWAMRLKHGRHGPRGCLGYSLVIVVPWRLWSTSMYFSEDNCS
jgi:hypothetical protein